MSSYNLNLKQIEAFVAVVDLGTFRQAAERLNTTQPNISNRIAMLEERTGVTLMTRDAGSIQLTSKGAELLQSARNILSSVDGFLVATEEDSAFEGVMRLGVSEMVVHTWLRPFLIQMKKRFPEICVELTVDLSAKLDTALFDRELDLVLQSGPFERLARCTVPLGRSAYMWVASPSLTVPRSRVDSKLIASYAILSHERGSAPYRQLEEHFREVGQSVRLVSSSNFSACLHMALDGLGIACLPEAFLTGPLKDDRLINLNYGWRPDDLRFAARYLLDPAPAYVREAVLIAQSLYPPDAN